ncbi:MAG: DUF1080 domain-containing protein [Planctomycetaceae bacterium]|nr:DUF1080 domain-containing protein [Planctomycetaceae bacterium]
MKCFKMSLCCALAVMFLGSSVLSAAEKKKSHKRNVPPAGFQALFNGKDLSGWIGMNFHSVKGKSPLAVKNMPAAEREELLEKNWKDVLEHWSVDKGELVNDGHGVYLTTATDYANFELLLDYKTVALADSGIYLRGVPQVQIWDTTEAGGKWKIKANLGSGGLFNNKGEGKHPLVHADNPFGEWNHLQIIMKGEKVTVYLNEKLVVDNKKMDNYFEKDQPIYATGPIQLQTHGGEIRFRDVFLKKLK